MAIKSHKLGPGLLTIGETGTEKEFASQLRSCTINPSTEEEDSIPVLSGEELAGDETYTFTISGSILDDYSSVASSLAAWSMQNKGVEMPFTFLPNSDELLQTTGTVKIRPIGIGGDVKSRNENDFEFKIVGDPVYADVV